MKPPCKDCPNRKAGCHGTCEPYLEFYKRQNEANRERWLAKQKRGFHPQRKTYTNKMNHEDDLLNLQAERKKQNDCQEK